MAVLFNVLTSVLRNPSRSIFGRGFPLSGGGGGITWDAGVPWDATTYWS